MSLTTKHTTGPTLSDVHLHIHPSHIQNIMTFCALLQTKQSISPSAARKLSTTVGRLIPLVAVSIANLTLKVGKSIKVMKHEIYHISDEIDRGHLCLSIKKTGACYKPASYKVSILYRFLSRSSRDIDRYGSFLYLR